MVSATGLWSIRATSWSLYRQFNDSVIHTSIFTIIKCMFMHQYVYIILSLCSQTIDITDEELSSLLDGILKDDDINDDGYIDYYEFIQAQRKNRGDA